MTSLVSLIWAVLSAVLAYAADGWKIEPLPKEEYEITYGEQLFSLIPPDNRPPIFIKEKVAHLIRSGKISEEVVYRGRGKIKENVKPSPSNQNGLPLAATETVVTSEPKASGSTDTSVVTTQTLDLSSKLDSAASKTWNPDANEPWPHNWEENVTACKDSTPTPINAVDHPGYLGNASNQILTHSPVGSYPRAKTHKHCNSLDNEEAARRSAYYLCRKTLGAPESQQQQNESLQDRVKEVWVSDTEAIPIYQEERSVFRAYAKCKDGKEVASVFVLSHNEAETDKCWVCVQGGAAGDLRYLAEEKMRFISALNDKKIRSVDLTRKPRASPMMSEFADSQIPGYWKSGAK